MEMLFHQLPGVELADASKSWRFEQIKDLGGNYAASTFERGV